LKKKIKITFIAIFSFQLIGWFFFGSFLIVKGAVLNSLNDGRSFDGLDMADGSEAKNVSSVDTYKVPWLKVGGLFLYKCLNISSPLQLKLHISMNIFVLWSRQYKYKTLASNFETGQ
jgi:hypothetical protein